jgi:hypothetical protein
VVAALGVPAVAIAATLQDEYRKPEPGMWRFVAEHFMDGVTPGGGVRDWCE